MRKMTVYEFVGYLIATIAAALTAVGTAATQEIISNPEETASIIFLSFPLLPFIAIPIAIIGPPVHFILNRMKWNSLIGALIVGPTAGIGVSILLGGLDWQGCLSFIWFMLYGSMAATSFLLVIRLGETLIGDEYHGQDTDNFPERERT